MSGDKNPLNRTIPVLAVIGPLFAVVAAVYGVWAMMLDAPGRTEAVFLSVLCAAAAVLSFAAAWRMWRSASTLERQKLSLEASAIENNRKLAACRSDTDALKSAMVELEAALEAAPFGVAVLNCDGRVSRANAALSSMIGVVVTQGDEFALLFSGDTAERLSGSINELAAGSVPGFQMDVEIRAAGEKQISLNATAIQAGQGRGILVHATDVSERKRLEVQFAQSQKMQAVGQLAGGVAHDFNNMLTAIIGFADLLLLRHQPGDPSFADAMQIKQNANRAAGLVRQLLAFSRQQRVRPRVLNVTDVLAELSMLLRRLLGESIELSMVHGRDIGRVRIDQGQFEQAVINLAVNARDAMPGGGRLTIQTDDFRANRPYELRGETMPRGDYVMINISDTGIGIPKENLERLFDPFFTTKEVGQGTGLGLSMVYGTIRQAGGFVVANSDGEGRGANFAIYLPRVEVEAADEGEEGASDTVESDVTGGESILLVEDEDAVRLFAARALRSKGYKVTEARTGEAALEILDDQDFDLLVTDMVMPRVDGATLINTARKTRPALPVICISGYTREAVANEVASLANVHFLPKPFSLKQLAGMVRGALESARDNQG